MSEENNVLEERPVEVQPDAGVDAVVIPGGDAPAPAAGVEAAPQAAGVEAAPQAAESFSGAAPAVQAEPAPAAAPAESKEKEAYLAIGQIQKILDKVKPAERKKVLDWFRD